MSEEENQSTEDVEALKARVAELEPQLKAKDERIAELEVENEKLRQTMSEATKTLTAYVEREKETAIKSVLEKANLWRKS
jgi:regulator of replication initiation timing